MSEFQGKGTPLDGDGFKEACDAADVAGPALLAVIAVETSGCGFLADRRPKILYERHYFSRLTGGRFDAEDPDISQPTPGGYGASGSDQYDRLAVAIGLDRAAALQSASWGLGQIMGANFKAAGYDDVEQMVEDMVGSEGAQLHAMASFLKANALDALLREQDWTGFARRYNGANYAANNYDGLLKQFYERYAGGSVPDLRVRAVQVYLTYKGFPPGGIDGILGARTVAAIRAFQQSIKVAETGVIDDQLIAQLAE